MNCLLIKRELRKRHKEFSRYTLIGILCFLLDFLLSMFIVKFTRLHYIYASAIGYTTGAILNYKFSISWVFKKRKFRDYWKTEFIAFMLIELFALLVMSGSLLALKESFKVRLKLAKILANIFAAMLNYSLKSVFLFKHNTDIMNPPPLQR